MRDRLASSRPVQAAHARPLWCAAALSGQSVQTYRMVRDIFMEVCQQEQQLEHSVALFRIGFAGALLEILDDGQGICQQPFEVRGLHGTALAALIECLIRAQKCFVEKMIETEPLGRKSGGDGLLARGS